MGRRGPPPTPTAVLRARGSWKADTRQDEPEPPPWVADCPAWLDGIGAETWRVLTTQLHSMGVLGNTDANTLARYCRTWAKWRACETDIDAHGQWEATEHGTSPTAASMLSLRLQEHLTKLEKELGLTPSARANLAKPKAADKATGKGRFFEGEEKTA